MIKLRNKTEERLSVVTKNNVCLFINPFEERRFENADAIFLLNNFSEQIENRTEVENSPDYRKETNEEQEFDINGQLEDLKCEIIKLNNLINKLIKPSWFKRLCSLIRK